jgi:pimeloyl-ACP methyl ester carboxylesterase
MRTHFTVAILAATLAACATAPPPDYKKPRLDLLPCQVRDVEEPLLCGTLEVPENRARPLGRTLKLNVVVAPAVSLVTLPPLYHLEGGPGLPASGSVGFWAAEGLIHRRNRDVVLVDQRGTGGSNALPCDVNFSSPLAPVLDRDAARACRYQLLSKAELAQYSTAAAVADLEAVREALGHERIDLSGLSYGTRLAQEYLRAHPARVRAMVLMGTVPPQEKLPLSFSANAHDVLMRLARQCEADAQCRRVAPRATADIAALRARFKAGPVRATTADGKAVTLEAGPFWEAVRARLTTTGSQRALPRLLREAAQGRFAPLLAAMEVAPDNAANGLLLSVTCHEDTAHITEAELAPLRDTVFGDYRARQQMAACREWPGSPVARNPSIVTSDVPALFLAGDMDHVTPVQWARDVASGLVNSRVVVVPNLGHFPADLTHMECYDRLIYDFFEAGSAANLDLSCVAAMQPPGFVQ